MPTYEFWLFFPMHPAMFAVMIGILNIYAAYWIWKFFVELITGGGGS